MLSKFPTSSYLRASSSSFAAADVHETVLFDSVCPFGVLDSTV